MLLDTIVGGEEQGEKIQISQWWEEFEKSKPSFLTYSR
jgi:hypothetical protein